MIRLSVLDENEVEAIHQVPSGLQRAPCDL